MRYFHPLHMIAKVHALITGSCNSYGAALVRIQVFANDCSKYSMRCTHVREVAKKAHYSMKGEFVLCRWYKTFIN